MFYCGPLHMNEQRLDDRQEPIYSSSEPIQDIAWNTCREQWRIETSSERVSGKSVLAGWHDHDDDDGDNDLSDGEKRGQACLKMLSTKYVYKSNI